MKVKYLGIVVGIVLAVLFLVGAGAAYESNVNAMKYSDGMVKDIEVSNLSNDSPSGYVAQGNYSQPGDVLNSNSKGGPETIWFIVKNIFKENPIVQATAIYAEYQRKGFEELLKSAKYGTMAWHPIFDS